MTANKTTSLASLIPMAAINSAAATAAPTKTPGQANLSPLNGLAPPAGTNKVDISDDDFDLFVEHAMTVADTAADDGYIDIFYELVKYTGPDLIYLRKLLFAYLGQKTASDPQMANFAYLQLVFLCVLVFIRGLNFEKAVGKMSVEGQKATKEVLAFFAPIMVFPAAGQGAAADKTKLTPSRLFAVVPDFLTIVATKLEAHSKMTGSALPISLHFPGSIVMAETVSDKLMQEYCQTMWQFDLVINSAKTRDSKALAVAKKRVAQYASTAANSPIRQVIDLLKVKDSKDFREFSVELTKDESGKKSKKTKKGKKKEEESDEDDE